MATQVSHIHFQRTRIPFKRKGGIRRGHQGTLLTACVAIIPSILIISLCRLRISIIEKIREGDVLSMWRTLDIRLRKFATDDVTSATLV